IYDFEQGITGHEATSPTSSTWTPGLDSELSTAHAPVPGSDVLTVRTTSGGMVQLTKKMNNNAASLHIEENSGINEGDILIISDCTNSSIFQVTNAEPDTSGTVVHNTGAASPGNSQKYLGKSFAKGAELQKLTTINYFVSPSEDDAKDCSEGCSLWRQVGDDDAEELVSGVENMQLLFGTDTDTDNSVDRYLTAEEVESLSLWSDVKSIRISLLLRSIDSALANLPAPSSQTLARRKVFPDPPDDQRLRRVFTTTIAIRNRVL
ncbi:MAG TPA: PilW family protein, partial [Gammaproteobacteria bacterium]|nr:PilW family protein [Gammaproteobacteria bacterium]